MNIKRIFNTVKYMNSRQLAYRFRYEISKRLCREIKIKGNFKINQNYQFRNKNFIIENGSIVSKADRILSNEFTFLNKLTYRFEEEIDWNVNPFNYRLWNFNLNYFDFLEILYNSYKATKDTKYLKKGTELIEIWIEKNRQYSFNTWDPYVVSKRVFNFINFISDIKDDYRIEKLNEINNSINVQARYLSNNIEYYLDANHVIMDAKGLVFAGIYLNNNEILKKGMHILEKEYKRQVLSDGGHYERSPSYQVEVLSHYVECYILLVRNDLSEKAKSLVKLIEEMSTYLYSIIMPNGNIPLLNDSSLDYPFMADDLLQVSSVILNKKLFNFNKLSEYALSILDDEEIHIFNELIDIKKQNNIENIKLEESGYYIIKDLINDEEIYILFDCGDGGPDYNLGHTHADSLNILISCGENELVMDSGTFTYKIGEDRNYYRSTIAHNTIMIDDKNSSDIWSGFRVAKRAKSFIEKYFDNNEYTYIRANHDGYSKTLNKDRIIHCREIVYLKGKGMFIIDSLKGRIRNNHNAVINYNIKKENFDSVKNRLFTDRNDLYFKINRDFNVNESKYSDKFNIEKGCYSIKSRWNFNNETSVVTSIIFNENKLEIIINKSKIDIMQEGIKIVEVYR